MSDPTVCPYCRMPFDENSPPQVFCTACGTPHHEDCYMENGGCTVFGCSRAPAEEPKLQVSYSDIDAAATATYPVQQPAVALGGSPAQPYGGSPGLSEIARGGAAAGAAVQSALSPSSRHAVAQHSPKTRTVYIVLGVFLGAFGVHNFYAGYAVRGAIQLGLSLILLVYMLSSGIWYPTLAPWAWALVEICVVNQDSRGLQFS